MGGLNPPPTPPDKSNTGSLSLSLTSLDARDRIFFPQLTGIDIHIYGKLVYVQKSAAPLLPCAEAVDPAPDPGRSVGDLSRLLPPACFSLPKNFPRSSDIAPTNDDEMTNQYCTNSELCRLARERVDRALAGSRAQCCLTLVNRCSPA